MTTTTEMILPATTEGLLHVSALLTEAAAATTRSGAGHDMTAELKSTHCCSPEQSSKLLQGL
jgi:hypothetical protein